MHAVEDGHFYHHDYKADIEEVVKENGFRFSNHTVTTEDGYILTAYRVRTKELRDGAPAALLQHGIMASADGWIAHHPEEAPAFVLAREGYDVWLASGRGTLASRGHTKYDADSPDWQSRQQYWAFSWQELGDDENPAFIELVRNVTKLDKITYVGHSQGTTQMFYSLLGKKQAWFKERVNLFVALAPVTQLAHQAAKPLTVLVFIMKPLIKVLNWLHVYSACGRGEQEVYEVVCAYSPETCLWV